ncbi:hypothetical protein [Saccharothrix sp. Mg75]|uniref:hypothetical protein n=1 Tax=Saccharothrix sp. Mg75 TaxID=3445357 RepID=UPI003EEA7F73
MRFTGTPPPTVAGRAVPGIGEVARVTTPLHRGPVRPGCATATSAARSCGPPANRGRRARRPGPADSAFAPRPCVLVPCEVVQHPSPREVPEAVVDPGDVTDEVANGWQTDVQATKVGGWAFWWQTSPDIVHLG